MMPSEVLRMPGRTACLLLCALLCCCQEGVIIEVNVFDRPADTSVLIVSAVLNDTMALGGVQSLDRRTEHFRVEIQDNRTGNLKLHLSAQDPTGCENAAGDGSVRLSGPGTYSIELPLTPQKGCTLEVERVGPAAGMVTSAPAGIACGSDCRYSFSRDRVVVLSKDTSALFGGWFTDLSQTSCIGRTSCAITIGSGITKVRTNFINPTSCVQSGWCIEEGLSASAGPANLYAVWGSGRDDVWAVGDFGTILHGDGILWQQTPSPLPSSLRGVWGSGPSDVYAVGTQGTVLHYDGTTWAALPVQTDAWLNAVWGDGRDSVWIVGDNGTILHGSSGGFTVLESGTTASLRGVWGSGPLDVWAVGDLHTVVRWRGALWERIETTPAQSSLYSVWGRGADDLWMVGDRGAILRYRGRLPFEDLQLGSTTALHAVWGTSATQIWTVGDKGAIWQWDGRSWSPVAPLPRAAHLAGLWGSGAQDLWAVGQSLGIVRYRP